MIVYTTPFLLAAAAAGQSLQNSRIGWQTWLRDLEASAITVSGETEEGPKDMPLRPDTGTYWLPPALPATYVADLGETRDVDYGGLVGSLGSSRASVLMETSIDDGVWTALGQEALPANDAPIQFLDSSRQARKVRWTFKGTGAVPRIAVLYAGEVLAMPVPPDAPYKPLNLSRETVLKQTLSRGGQFLGQEIQRMGTKSEASYSLLNATWLREKFDPFVRAARRYPYFFGWQPGTYPLEVGYVWTDRDIVSTQLSFALMNVSWAMRGIGANE